MKLPAGEINSSLSAMNSGRFPSSKKRLGKIRFTTHTPSLTPARPKIRLARTEPTKPAGAGVVVRVLNVARMQMLVKLVFIALDLEAIRTHLQVVQQACMEKSAGTSVVGLQDSRFRYFKNQQGRLFGKVTAGKRPGCSEPLTPLEVAASPALRGPLLAPIRYKTANGSYHSTRRASEFTLDSEIIAITPISSASKKIKTSSSSKSCPQNPVSKILFFFLPKTLSFFSVKHSPSYTKNQMSYQAFPSSLLPEPKVKLFPLARHRNKIKLILPRRQTVLRNSPTRPATPYALPKDLQIANWKARTLS
ncbi:hypothetical protein AVEN_158170-1 [Araneus ventricosus]|uniref:Uncharacterized protein n=1 Tax=Araneus ventricosus TaxID=182803 RepID=A0A4Y2G5T4_ARAVE|nr:hypothetical protein AVEN_158170-1 [Araneus ventricosus]